MNKWPNDIPQELEEYYGKPGTNQTIISLPYPFYYKGQAMRRLCCHQKVTDSLTNVLENVLLLYGSKEIHRLKLDVFGGCYNKRNRKGGSTWSLHAYAAALDFAPDENQLHWNSDKALFAQPEYDAWWSCWLDEGWTSLGIAKNYDWMHVQAANIVK